MSDQVPDGFRRIDYNVSIDRSSQVLRDDLPVPEHSLQVGDEISCMTIAGRVRAKVTELGEHPTAETPGLILPLQVEGGFWCCNSAYSSKVRELKFEKNDA